MSEIVLNKGRFLIPTTLTAATLIIVASSDQIVKPIDYDAMAPFSIKQREWEESYQPSSIQDKDYERLQTIQQFANDLLSETYDIPLDFAKVLNEEFWDII